MAVAPGLQSTGSVVVGYWLSCSTARGIFPDQGSNPCLLHCKADTLPRSHQRSPQIWYFKGGNHPCPQHTHTHTLLTSGGLCPISLTAEIPSWRHCWILFTFPSHPEGSVGLTQNHGTEWMGLEQELQSYTEVTENSPISQSFLYPRRAACSRHSINIY